MKFHKYPLLLAFISLSFIPIIVKAQENVQNFWSDYPPCEEACHESVFTSQQCTLENSCGLVGCSGGCLCLDDRCFCLTSSWLIAVAQCIGKSCGASDVTTAASILQSACDGNGLPLAVGTATLISYGMAAIPTEAATTQQQVVTVTNTLSASLNPSTQTSTPSSPSTTTSPPPSTSSTSSSTSSSPTPTQSSSSSPSSDILTGIIVPSIIGGAAILAAFIFWLVKRETAVRYFKHACCCCLYKDDNGIPLRGLRGAP